MSATPQATLHMIEFESLPFRVHITTPWRTHKLFGRDDSAKKCVRIEARRKQSEAKRSDAWSCRFVRLFVRIDTAPTSSPLAS